MEYFKINDKLSTDFSVFVAKSNLLDSASEDVSTVEVSGRNGALHISNNRFKSFTAELECYITDLTKWEDFKSYLLSLQNTFKLSESYFSNVYRIARLQTALSLGTFNKKKGTFTLSFNCRPEIYLTSGDTEQTLSSSTTITNPTLFESKPIFIVVGNGTLTVNGNAIVVSSSESSVTIDCDRMDCYNGDVNCNNDVTLTEFPTLKSGSNTISYTGFTSVKLKGKWWRL